MCWNKSLYIFILLYLAFPSFAQTDLEYLHLQGNTADIDIFRNVISLFDDDIFVFQKNVGIYPQLIVPIRIATDQEEYQSWTAQGGILEFSQAFYDRRSGTIFLRHPSELKSLSALRKILLHEYIHLFVDYYWQDAPLWFSEGMAVYFSNDLSFERELNYAKNFLLGNSRTLLQMSFSYPKNQIEWESFYAKSALAVKYLHLKNRNEFYRLWDFAEKGDSFHSAFTKAFLMKVSEFSFFFESYIKARFRMEILLASTGIIWSILPLVLIIGFIRKKIRNRKKLKEWEFEETELNKLQRTENEGI